MCLVKVLPHLNNQITQGAPYVEICAYKYNYTLTFAPTWRQVVSGCRLISRKSVRITFHPGAAAAPPILPSPLPFQHRPMSAP